MVNTIKFSQFGPLDLNNLTNTMVGTTDPSGGSNIKTEFTTAWTTTTRPTLPYEGLQGYNATLGVPEYWDGLAWVPMAGGGGGGGITQINTGTGLTGGPITTTGTVSFAEIAAKSLWVNTNSIVDEPVVTPLTNFLLSANNLSELTNLANARANLFLSATTGTPGQILTSNGAIVAPTWQDVGAGTVGIGNINEIAHYPVTGTSVTGLPTQNLGVLVTDATGVPSISAGGQIPGTTTNNVANAGNVGEHISSTVLIGSAVGAGTGTIINVTSIVLSPGDWDVWGTVWSMQTGTATQCAGGITPAASTLPTVPADDVSFAEITTTVPVFSDSVLALSACRVPTAAPITYYLTARAFFPSGTVAFYGNIHARRRR